MMRFDDYHRTVIGYHGTKLSVAMDIVKRKRRFKYSQNRDDWLGHGIFFWEYAPQQAYWWAERRKRRQKWDEPIAILGSMIRLGFCFDLLDPYNVMYLKQIFEEYVNTQLAAGQPLPKNANHYKFLDCAVFQYAYAAIENFEGQQPADSARAVYVPTGEDKRVWERSWITNGAHIQICVRNTACILGTWLHHPTDLEESDATQAFEAAENGFEPENQGSGKEAEGDANGGSGPTDGQGETDDSGRSRPGEAEAG
jgi:hypothetical protein